VSQAAGAQGVDEQGNDLRVGGGAAFADEVGVELKMFAQTALLLAFVAEKLRDGEPLDGLFVTALVRGDHARERRRHFRPQRNFTVTFVFEIIKLRDNFFAALGCEEFERFERRAVVFAEAVTARDRPPFFKNKLARVGAPNVRVRQRFGIKIAKSGQSFHASRLKNAGRKEKTNHGK